MKVGMPKSTLTLKHTPTGITISAPDTLRGLHTTRQALLDTMDILLDELRYTDEDV